MGVEYFASFTSCQGTLPTRNPATQPPIVPKTEKRKERDAKYRQPLFLIDPSAGICSPQPWRVLPSGDRHTGRYFTLQIDTRPGLARLDTLEPVDPGAGLRAQNKEPAR